MKIQIQSGRNAYIVRFFPPRLARGPFRYHPLDGIAFASVEEARDKIWEAAAGNHGSTEWNVDGGGAEVWLGSEPWKTSEDAMDHFAIVHEFRGGVYELLP